MSIFKKIAGGYDELWKAIIRPPRDTYDILDLGESEFTLDRRTFIRKDIELVNSRGFTLQCSHFEPIESERVAPQLPCVIYLHGNCSSRIEALNAAPVLLPCNITLFCFDFSGSGLSGGEYISLGWHERDDLACVVDYLRGTGTVSCIGLWGRSMGAVTALMHGDRDPSIAGMVLDSPFTRLKTLAEELAKSYAKVPKLVLSGAMSLVSKSVRKRAKFKIKHLCPLDHADKCFIPALFATGNQDTFILPHHTQEIYDRYAGDKNIIFVEGDHNSPRPQFFLDSVAIFFYNTLMCDTLPKLAKPLEENKDIAKFKARQRARVHKMEYQEYLLQQEEDDILRAIEQSLKVSEPQNPSAPLQTSEESSSDSDPGQRGFGPMNLNKN
jgi:pimeloyl-ACP methyl ester carboxylesterase